MEIKLLVILVMMVLNGWYCLGCWEEERVALLHLKANINFPDGESLSSWVVDQTATDCCQWEGVKCNDTTKRVILLDLIGVRRYYLGDWYFNASLFLPFRELRNLSLVGNRLVGWIENEGIDRLSKLRNLESLDLSHNSFDRKILSSLSWLSSLKYLGFGYNSLRRKNYSISGERLFGLTKLEVLHFMGNDDISNGNILSVLNLSDFINLKELDLSDNQFRSFDTIYELRRLRRLEGLFLNNSTVDGNFLQSIGALSSLKILSLSNCGLNGTLPVRGWCELKNLQELDLRWNKYEGVLPSCVANMTSLRLIELSHNKFTGNIASSPLSKLTSLEYISLSSNNFQIPISFKAFFNHSNLKFLFLGNNEIINENELEKWVPSFQLEVFTSNSSGLLTLPNFFYYQSNLRILDLSKNNIGGNFPTWLLENNTRLWGLYLRANAFAGTLMLPTSTNINMSDFDVSNNKLNGRIPINITSVFPNLSLVNMSTNMFDGCIPSSFGDLKYIVDMDLSNNNLSGTMPQELVMGSFYLFSLKLSNNRLQGQIFPQSPESHLTFLYLDGNEFSGTVPSSLFSRQISVLDISDNRLSGRIPTSVGNMQSPAIISMSNNQLEGPIPVEICTLKYLDVLDLSHNKLCGSVPSCSSLSTIRHVYLNNNQLEGELTDAFYNSSDLVSLDLSENKFTGSIPPWIGNLSSMRILLLRGNHFEGTIPHQFCEMNKLSMIDLSFNSLSGKIPRCFGNISLEVTKEKSELTLVSHKDPTLALTIYMLVHVEVERGYHVSYRNPYSDLLTDVPITVTFTTKRNSYPFKGNILNYMSGIDLSSNKLHGEIPDGLGNLSEIHALNLSHNNLIGTIPATFSSLHQIESLDLSYNNLGGKIPNGLIELNALEVFSVAHNNLTGMIPEKGQFGTFDEDSYQGNPYLCGRPLPVNCTSTGSTPVLPSANDENEERGFMDMEVFYISFIISYICVVLCIATVLYINPYWRRAGFVSLRFI